MIVKLVPQDVEHGNTFHSSFWFILYLVLYLLSFVSFLLLRFYSLCVMALLHEGYFSNYICATVFFQRQEGIPKLFRDGLFLMRGKRWKETRNILTPTFSAGKLKQVIVEEPFLQQQILRQSLLVSLFHCQTCYLLSFACF